MSLQKAAYAELRVNDLDAELDFVTEVMGLQVVGSDAEATYLGCGYDENIDLTLRSGGTGVHNFAFGVQDGDVLDAYEHALKSEGISSSRVAQRMPGVAETLRFTLPDGHSMELVVLTQSQEFYTNAATSGILSRHSGVSPLDVDHVVLRTPDVKRLAGFLTEVLDFRVSDAFEPAPGIWGGAWARVGEQHHDLAFMQQSTPNESFDHLSWTVSSFDHIKHALDCTTRAGLRVETGPGRHGVGGNLYAYFWTPGGNRFEFSAEMPRVVHKNDTPKIWTDPHAMFSAWGAAPPETFEKGS